MNEFKGVSKRQEKELKNLFKELQTLAKGSNEYLEYLEEYEAIVKDDNEAQAKDKEQGQAVDKLIENIKNEIHDRRKHTQALFIKDQSQITISNDTLALFDLIVSMNYIEQKACNLVNTPSQRGQIFDHARAFIKVVAGVLFDDISENIEQSLYNSEMQLNDKTTTILSL